ncbi:hypothetical protein [Asaia astilbis]|uniref:hypothetical protein n=1 Tax=Asaia astilbis TaxID=610244 RepID=UPI00046F1DD1|nr:hypothetical protein [Asaia astilbis]
MTAEPDDLPQDRSPRLSVTGFEGSLAQLVALARTHRIDLTTLSLSDMIDQLTRAVQAELAHAPRQAGDWIVLTGWLIWLRSAHLSPLHPPEATSVTNRASLPHREDALLAAQQLAHWLQNRPRLGYDVFPKGASEASILTHTEVCGQIDRVEFLWAAMSLLGAPPLIEDYQSYHRPVTRFRWTAAPAEERIRTWLADGTQSHIPLEHLKPDLPGAESVGTCSWLRPRAALTSVFSASLELARQGALTLEQDLDWAPITVSRPSPTD